MAMQKRYTFQSLRSSLKADAAMGAWSMKQCNEYGHLIQLNLHHWSDCAWWKNVCYHDNLQNLESIGQEAGMMYSSCRAFVT